MIIFSSVFFVSLGVLADVRSIDTRVILFLVVLTISAFASKLIGCGGVALLRGAQEVYVSSILMSLFTTIVTPILLRNWLFRPRRNKRAPVLADD